MDVKVSAGCDCDQKFTITNVMEKVALRQVGEDTWEYIFECPLCHKRFTVRVTSLSKHAFKF